MEEGESYSASQDGRARNQNEAGTNLEHGQESNQALPSLSDSSLVETTRLYPDEEQHVDSMTEEEHVRAHLQDVESSFIPPASPTIEMGESNVGIDDTYLFDAVPKKPLTPVPESVSPAAPLAVVVEESDSQTAPKPTSEAPETNQQPTREPTLTCTSPLPTTTIQLNTPPPDPPVPESLPDHPETIPTSSRQPESEAGFGATDTAHTTSSLEQPISSPTPAVAARAASRARSAVFNAELHEQINDPRAQEDNDAPEQDDSNIESAGDVSFSTEIITLQHQNADENSDMNSSVDLNRLSVDAGATPGNALKVTKRPRYLRSRNASQRSSASSFPPQDDDDGTSDITVGQGADYALQTGGAAPAFGLTRSVSNDLSRSISMGSMASGFDDSFDHIQPSPLEPLEEVNSPVHERHSDALATPKATKLHLKAPTDTVIARHVRSVEVPEFLANEYRSKGGLSTPLSSFRKPSDYTPAPSTAARSGRNMTLKEQSSTIERLSKANFDLKLKVMFLSDRLDKLSEEGIKEMISENVELRTSLAVIQRDNKMLRRRVKELEKRLRDEEDRPSTARSGFSSDGRGSPAFNSGAQAYEEEVILLRERVEKYERENERLRLASELDKRKLAETVKAMGDRAADRVGENLGRQEAEDVWKDLLEQETARLEQADEENRQLRDEIFSLKQEMSGSGPAGGGLHHTTNIYNITRKPRQSSPTRSRPVSGLSGDADQTNSISQSSTLVEDLRRESEKLRHENAELRREVGAQTSMLTSRNREKERLYQEIEELKLAQRRGGQAPSTLDTLLDRSASRVGARDRPISRGSGQSRMTAAVEDPDREELENKIGEQRDRINELKFKNQELQRELETCMAELEEAVAGKSQAEENVNALQDELEATMNDLMTIQAERDEALEEQAVWENKFADLQEEAQGLVTELEAETDLKSDEIQRLQMDLQDRSENFDALQEEMRSMTESLIRLEDEHVKTQKRTEQLEQELAESSKELEDLEAQLLESNEKAQRLAVQQESSQGEIAFLREEQEGDKIRIGDLEDALANAEQTIVDEREHAKELDQRLANEREQRELIANQEKEEVQRVINDLNRDASTTKEENRRLRQNLSILEVEATKYKERLTELENNLRGALGELGGTRSTILQSITTLQRSHETTVSELNTTKSLLAEKDHLIKQRDSLLESHALESRRLGELLDKERQAHRNTKNQFETFQRAHQHMSRTVTSQDSRIIELETSRAQDRKRITHLEATFKEQLAERNNLLLVLWTRLSVLCGSDWAHDNSLINGRALPSLESVSTMLSGFSKNLLAAIKMIESMMNSFESRIKAVERDLWKEYQTLENNLDARTKKLERLEALVRSGITSGNLDAQTKLSQLEVAYRALKIENATLQRARDARNRSVGYADRTLTKNPSRHGSPEELIEAGSPSPLVPTGPHGRESKLPRSKTTHLEATTNSTKSTMTSMTRSSSNSGAADVERLGTSQGGAGSMRGSDENRWMMRLRELEYKLKQEREARQMDRAAARQRVQDSERQNNELAAELVRANRKNRE